MGLADRVRRLERAGDERLDAQIEAARRRLGEKTFEATLRDVEAELQQEEARHHMNTE